MEPRAYPWVISIRYFGIPICAGTLISQEHVLTVVSIIHALQIRIRPEICHDFVFYVPISHCRLTVQRTFSLHDSPLQPESTICLKKMKWSRLDMSLPSKSTLCSIRELKTSYWTIVQSVWNIFCLYLFQGNPGKRHCPFQGLRSFCLDRSSAPCKTSHRIIQTQKSLPAQNWLGLNTREKCYSGWQTLEGM